MAIEFTNEGLISLENRIAVFDGHGPVNQPHWDYIKKLPDMVKDGRTYEVSKHTIGETWNAVIDPFTNTLLRSPQDQFLMFCKQNMICVRETENGTYKLRHKLLKNITRK